jgi:hypothetical protein
LCMLALLLTKTLIMKTPLKLQTKSAVVRNGQVYYVTRAFKARKGLAPNFLDWTLVTDKSYVNSYKAQVGEFHAPTLKALKQLLADLDFVVIE